ncbi:MAG: thioredoxin domain-containing protein [Bryobacteraceae bacterium]
MLRKLSLSLAAVCLGAYGQAHTATKSAFDKATLEAYVRHMYVMDSRIGVQISDPKPDDLPGFKQVTVRATMGDRSQDILFHISDDGKKIVQGTVFDISRNPFQADLDKLKPEGAPGEGTTGAPVAIVEFSDFECPFCREEAKLLQDNLLKTYPTQVKLYFKEFPLEGLHPWAKRAAMAARCIARQGTDAFWAYHDWIFAHQDQITPDNLRDQVMDWAKAQGQIDTVKLGQCMEDKLTEAEVDKTVAQGRELGINGTPTLFVNGRRIDKAIDWPTLKSIIDFEIEYQKTAHDAGDDCGCELKLNLPGEPAPKPTIGFPAQK